ncbi:YitT family protein [Sporosarcina sp. HYO08]|uniref:YitT family protein n=1 Tax=Sporosarcina sp. HYO08 TaxID=1759557 RepID=UPI0007954BA6|nr:YitT family protein [Sporosarcina sp. HYO08]KXH87119.1 hypothetical protein AU377_00645 [Sporosarcina sp. HYO08]
MFFFYKTMTIFIGSILIAIGLNVFLVPFGLMEGGALGISLVFHYLFGTKVGLTFLIISAPIFMLAWVYFRRFFYNGIHGMLLSSIIIDFFYPLHHLGGETLTTPLVSAAIGGIVIGMGIGIMLRADISIGGIDLLAQMIAKKLHINAGIMIFLLDALIVVVGSLLVHSIYLIYSITTVIFVGITASFIVDPKNILRPNKKSDQV